MFFEAKIEDFKQTYKNFFFDVFLDVFVYEVFSIDEKSMLHDGKKWGTKVDGDEKLSGRC